MRTAGTAFTTGLRVSAVIGAVVFTTLGVLLRRPHATGRPDDLARIVRQPARTGNDGAPGGTDAYE